MIPRDKPASADGEIEITPEMIEAGVTAIERHLLEDGLTQYARREAAHESFRAMCKAATGYKFVRSEPAHCRSPS